MTDGEPSASAAGLAHDEPARLRTLRELNVLDSLPEAFSDSIAAAAAALAGVPMSAVSLVDAERQWFKASCGLPVSETHRDVSFCAHAIKATEPFLVEDALADDRFRDNPLVTGEPYIRAYAGIPLVVNGHAVGALCVIDDRPRRLSDETLALLQRLAAGAAAWLTERQHMTSALHKSREQLRHQIFNDAATGLPTSHSLTDRLMRAIERSDRTRQQVTVLYVRLEPQGQLGRRTAVDLDAEVLRAAGQRLAQIIRSSDTVARVGDSDFVVLAEGQGHLVAARRVAVSIHAAFRLPVLAGGGESFLSAAVGASFYPQDGPGNRLVTQAALACAQPEARSGCGFFKHEIVEAGRRRADLLVGLSRARERRELSLCYQPKIDASTGQVTGVEALLRWHHPELGSVSPGEFIPLAEESGLIDDIGHWVMAEAFGQIRRWRQSGLSLRVAVNLSARQLHRATLADEIEALLRLEEVDPASVIFEVTESVTMDDATAASFVFARLRAVGVQLSIDDFGTGYSSLAYLRRLPVQQLKIDRSFVADLTTGDDAHAIVKAIIQLAHALRLEVVAEGVETEAQRLQLCGFGCDKLQGFLFARPMPAEALVSWIQDWAAIESARDASA